MNDPAQRPERRFPRASWLMLGWLTAVWVMLWGDLTAANVIAGFVIALVVTTVLPLPRVPFAGRIRPWGIVRLLAAFLRDLLIASVQIAATTVAGRRPKGAVVRVRLRSYSDLVLTLTSGFVSLVPGSIVVETHRLDGTMYVHVFDVDRHGGVEAAQRTVLEQEQRVLRAVGSADQLADAGMAPAGTGEGERR